VKLPRQVILAHGPGITSARGLGASESAGAYVDSLAGGDRDLVGGVCKALGLPRVGWVLDARNLGCGLFELAGRQTGRGRGWAQVPDWMHALVLASLVHPDPPAELLAHASKARLP
jgi:hypothetical protein